MRPLSSAAIVAALILVGRTVYAQPASANIAPTCDQKAAAAKRAWAQAPHSDLANVFHSEFFGIGDTWCRIWEVHGSDRRFKIEDFGRTLFTGEGIHPVVASSLVPGSGFAAGVSFSVGQNLTQQPLRLWETVDARVSTNGSREYSGRFEILGTSRRGANHHNNATVVVERQELAQLTDFGPGNDSSRDNESVFGLTRTVAGGIMEVPLPNGVFASFQVSGLWLRPFAVQGAAVPSIEVRFPTTIATIPAMATPTSYLVYGGGLRWMYPIDAVTTGYATELGATLRNYHNLNALPFSFARIDLAWTNRYVPNAALGSVSVNALATLSVLSAGHAVPFYLQPTLGGTDLSGVSALRSFQDYRFRAPNRLALIVEHEHDLVGPLGTLVFVDWGQVGEHASEFAAGRFHHSFGAGVSVRAGNVTVLRAFFAWGGGEGTRTTFFGSSDRFASVLRTRTLF